MNHDNTAGTVFDDAIPLVTIEFDAFFELYHQRYLDYARAQLTLSEPEDVQEVVETVFAGLGEDWERILQHPNPAAHAWGALRYLVEVEHRRRGEVLHLVEKAVFVEAERNLFRSMFGALEDNLGLLNAFKHLPARQYDALLLTGFLKYSAVQAGDVMGISPMTVRALVHQARARFDKNVLHAAAPATEKE
ncbi:sigma factor-like helix-turn-helix DNA-binding protein [Kitasatospora cineracea]|uniref:sigma factor-like helix-turn-helix DNA-binding protein n=1 Tax=Kitasatospora cineracea TaxID=88074 RepID=UPI0033C08B53